MVVIQAEIEDRRKAVQKNAADRAANRKRMLAGEVDINPFAGADQQGLGGLAQIMQQMQLPNMSTPMPFPGQTPYGYAAGQQSGANIYGSAAQNDASRYASDIQAQIAGLNADAAQQMAAWQAQTGMYGAAQGPQVALAQQLGPMYGATIGAQSRSDSLDKLMQFYAQQMQNQPQGQGFRTDYGAGVV